MVTRNETDGVKPPSQVLKRPAEMIH